MKRALQRVDQLLAAVVSTLVVFFLSSMVLISFTQVILRNFFSTGIGWGDVVLRYLVIAVGMFGATLAARQGRQISIDVFSRILPEAARKVVTWLIGLFTIVVSSAMGQAAIVFVRGEHEFGTEIYPGLEAWYFQLVIPIGFFLIAFQVLLNLLLGRKIAEPAPPALTKSGESEAAEAAS